MRLPLRVSAACLLGASLLCGAAPASAQGAPSPSASGTKAAAGHFKRGVSLYKDGDYGGALVEFQRAYDSAPNFRVLYDLGQSFFQLQRYAEALTAFESYLAKGGPQIPAARRESVENDLRTLRSRVGHVTVTVNEAGADILIDDQSVGASPLAAPVLVSVGHRKIRVAKAGRPEQERFVDVAAGDSVKVTFEVAEPAPPPLPSAPVQAPAPPPPLEPAPPPAPDQPAASRSGSIPWIPWAVTGVMAAGTAVTGALALASQSSLNTQLGTFPGNPGAIQHDRSSVTGFSLASDILLGVTAASLGLSIYLTLTPSRSRSALEEPATRIVLGPGGLHLTGEY